MFGLAGTGGEGDPSCSRAETSTDVLSSDIISTLGTISTNTASLSSLYHLSYFSSIDNPYPCLPLILVLVPPAHRQEGMGVGDSLETLQTKC